MSFYNIFSKKSAKPQDEKKPIIIIIDNRERNSLVPSELANLGAKLDFQQLGIGDYIIKNTVIERKTVQDLKSSIINKRIYEQIKNLKQQPGSLLLIEGIQDEDIYSGIIHENALRGFLLSAALEYQTPIIFTQNAKDTAKYLYVLAKKPDKAKPISLLTKRRPETLEEQKQFILESFPGIGPQTAKKLTGKFKTIKNIINADEKELREVLGKKTESFKKVIND